MKIHGTAKGAALSTKDFGVAFGGAAVEPLTWTVLNFDTTPTTALHNQSNSWTNYAYTDFSKTSGEIIITGQMSTLDASTKSIIGLNDGATSAGWSPLCSFRCEDTNSVDIKKYPDVTIVALISVSDGDIFKVKYSWDTGYATFYINGAEVSGSATAFSPTTLNGYVAGYALNAGATDITVTGG